MIWNVLILLRECSDIAYGEWLILITNAMAY